jgi:hypothetical protein
MGAWSGETVAIQSSSSAACASSLAYVRVETTTVDRWGDDPAADAVDDVPVEESRAISKVTSADFMCVPVFNVQGWRLG